MTDDPNKVHPKCPKRGCSGKVKQSFQDDVGMDVGAGKAPAITGANVAVKAFDVAHEIAMADHQMTDIRTDIRAGEGVGTQPRLPQHLQKQADAFWGGQQQKPRMRTAKIDLSPVLGPSPGAQGASAQKFTADVPNAIEPILKHKPAGSSPIPPYTVVAG